MGFTLKEFSDFILSKKYDDTNFYAEMFMNTSNLPEPVEDLNALEYQLRLSLSDEYSANTLEDLFIEILYDQDKYEISWSGSQLQITTEDYGSLEELEEEIKNGLVVVMFDLPEPPTMYIRSRKPVKEDTTSADVTNGVKRSYINDAEKINYDDVLSIKSKKRQRG